MNDVELVLAARGGDASAVPAIFDRHAARVHDLAFAMLRDRVAALEVVEATFVEAIQRLAGLEEEHRLAVWLLAVTRRNAARRAGPTAGIDRQPALPDDDPEKVHLAGLVWEAVADLPLRDRTLVDLELRQGLVEDDLADALGVTRSQAQDLRADMIDRIERGLAGYLVARTGNGRCPALAKVLKRWDGRFTSRDSVRLAAHVDVCTVCTQARFDLPSPFALYAIALPAPFPDEVRARVVERVLSVALPEPARPADEPTLALPPVAAPDPAVTAATSIWGPSPGNGASGPAAQPPAPAPPALLPAPTPAPDQEGPSPLPAPPPAADPDPLALSGPPPFDQAAPVLDHRDAGPSTGAADPDPFTDGRPGPPAGAGGPDRFPDGPPDPLAEAAVPDPFADGEPEPWEPAAAPDPVPDGQPEPWEPAAAPDPFADGQPEPWEPVDDAGPGPTADPVAEPVPAPDRFSGRPPEPPPAPAPFRIWPSRASPPPVPAPADPPPPDPAEAGPWGRPDPSGPPPQPTREMP